jgi:hypothetical protein
VRRLPGPLKLGHAELFALIDRALVSLSREGQPVAVKLQESDLVGAEARVVMARLPGIGFKAR